MSRWTLAAAIIGGILLGMTAMRLNLFNIGGADRVRTEAVVRDYLLANPEIIPAAMQKLQEREGASALRAERAGLERPYAGAWIGNPKGDVTVVEYFDYNCGYCRASLPIVRQLVAEDPKVRVVFREMPILAESSLTGARASLAAAEQGRFLAFHAALYGNGRVTDESVAAAAQTAGVDLARVGTARADAEIGRNLDTTGRLGIKGTPAWIVGDRILSGAMPLDALRRAVAEARKR